MGRMIPCGQTPSPEIKNLIVIIIMIINDVFTNFTMIRCGKNVAMGSNPNMFVLFLTLHCR